MSTAEQWAGVLGGAGRGQFSLKFERLGLEAQCRTLQAGEVEECIRMGGERGLRYALYLACDDLREAGESLKKQGVLASAFDITERLSYGDVLAAGAAILQQSGASQSRVMLEGGESTAPQAIAMPEGQADRLLPAEAQSIYPGAWQPDGQMLRENNQLTAGQMAREFADRLFAAAGNR